MKKIFYSIIIALLLNNFSNVFSQVIIPNFTDYKQVVPAYGTIPIGNGQLSSMSTICGSSHLGYCNFGNHARCNSLYCAGCVVTSVTMLLDLNGLSVDPIIVNNWLKNTLHREKLNHSDICQYPGSTILYSNTLTAFNTQAIQAVKNSIDNNNPVIMRVNSDSHTVVIRGYKSPGTAISDFIVSDPADTISPIKFASNYSFTKLDFYTNVYRKRLINDNTEIYAGSVASPKTFKIWFYLNGISPGFTVSQFKIYKNNTTVNISPSAINIDAPVNNKGSFTVNLTHNMISSLTDTIYNLSFNINSPSNHFSGSNQIYFTDPSELTDIHIGDWYKNYMYDGVNLGLFRGKYTTTFAPDDNLTWAAAAKVIVNAALKLGLYDIDASTTLNGTFSDIFPNYAWAYPYVQTLRNKGYVDPNTNFNPGTYINAGQFAEILCKALQLSNSYINAYTWLAEMG